MGVGKGLKISKIRGCATIAVFVERYTFFDLLADAFFRVAIGRVEGIIATECAASGADGAVAVRAAEPRVDADFLDTGAELARDVRGIAVEAAVIVPGEHCNFFAKIQFFLSYNRTNRANRTNRINRIYGISDFFVFLQ